MSISLADQTRLEAHLANLSKERRTSNREDCAFEAVVQYNRAPKDTVYVRDISKKGLMMIVTPGTHIPEEFQLLGLEEQPVSCHWIWRDGDNVGVEFITELKNIKPSGLSRL
jgi:hypothetical protein